VETPELLPPSNGEVRDLEVLLRAHHPFIVLETDDDCLVIPDINYACCVCAVCAPRIAINRGALFQYQADSGRLVGARYGGGGCAPCCTPTSVPVCQAANVSGASILPPRGRGQR
jgi:hypothetical protein